MEWAADECGPFCMRAGEGRGNTEILCFAQNDDAQAEIATP